MRRAYPESNHHHHPRPQHPQSHRHRNLLARPDRAERHPPDRQRRRHHYPQTLSHPLETHHFRPAPRRCRRLDLGYCRSHLGPYLLAHSYLGERHRHRPSRHPHHCLGQTHRADHLDQGLQNRWQGQWATAHQDLFRRRTALDPAHYQSVRPTFLPTDCYRPKKSLAHRCLPGQPAHPTTIDSAQPSHSLFFLIFLGQSPFQDLTILQYRPAALQ